MSSRNAAGVDVRANVRSRRDEGLIPGDCGARTWSQGCEKREKGQRGEAPAAGAKPSPGNAGDGGRGVGAGAGRTGQTRGSALRGGVGQPGGTEQKATRGQGMPGRGTGPGVRRREGSGAAASAASPLPGMSEEPPRRLDGILASAAGPTAFGGGPLGSPPSPPSAGSCQPGPAPQSSAVPTRNRSSLSSVSRGRRLSANRQGPGRWRDHTSATIG